MARAFLLALSLCLLLPQISAAEPDYIGLFADASISSCRLDLTPGVADTLFVLAVVPDFGDSGITAAEFAVDGLPEHGPGGMWLTEWATDLTIGNVETGIALAFTDPVAGEAVELGRIIFHSFSVDWVEPDHEITIVEPLYQGSLSLVTHDFQQVPVPGTRATLNCAIPDDCACDVPTCATSPEHLDFGAVSTSGYADLEFTVTNNTDDSILMEPTTDHPFFQVVSTTEFMLGYGESAIVTVRFAPQEVGPFVAHVSTGGNCGGPTCSGMGANLCTVLPESPIDLGVVALGEYLETGFQVANGEGSAQNLELQIQTTSPHLSFVSGNDVSVLYPGQVLEVVYRYHPMSEGPHDCLVTLGNPDCGDLLIQGTGLLLPGSPPTVDHLGFYQNPNASDCDAELRQNHWEYLPMVAVLPDVGATGLTRATFRVDNLPTPETGFTVNWSWEDGVTESAGDPWMGLTLEFEPPLTDHFSEIGTFAIRKDSPWGDSEFSMVMVGPTPSGIATTDADGVDGLVAGGSFHFNCATEQDCDCGDLQDPACWTWPTELDFGLVWLGESADREFSVVNFGGGLVQGHISEASEPIEVVNGGGDFILAAGESLQVVLRYTPTAVGIDSGIIHTGLDDCNAVHWIATGDSEPVCDVSPDSLYFGELQLGETGESGFWIRNEGGSVVVGEVTLSDETHFSIVSGGGSFELGILESRWIDLHFEPQSMGSHHAEVYLGSDLCLESVPLSGIGRDHSEGSEQIGLFSDTDATLCELDLIAGITDTLHVVANTPGIMSAGLAGARFAIEGLPPQGAGGSWWAEWEAESVVGDIATGLYIAFDEPLFGNPVVLGHIIFSPASDEWVSEDSPVLMIRHESDETLVLLDSHDLPWSAYGGGATINCSDPEGCDCPDLETSVCATDVDSLDFGQVPVNSSSYAYIEISNPGYGSLEGVATSEGEGFLIFEGAGAFSLPHGETHTIGVRFHPGYVQDYEGAIQTGLDECPMIPLSGEGAPSIQDSDFIRCFADLEAMECSEDISPFASVTIYAMASLPTYYQDEGFLWAEFRIDNLPEPGEGVGSVTLDYGEHYWNGDPWSGVAVGNSSQVIHLPTVLLFSMEFLAFDDAWIGEDHLIEVTGTSEWNSPVIRTGAHYRNVEGREFTFNCTDWFSCVCEWEDWPQPVTLASFSIEPRAGAADLRWELAGGEDVAFRLEADSNGAMYEIPYVAHPNSLFSATDEGANLADGGDVIYRLHAREAGGAWELMRSETITVPPLPRQTALLPPHPNPFNPRVSVPFTLRSASAVRLCVYDVVGRRVATLVDGHIEAGEYEWIWEGQDDRGREVGSGVYFLHFEAQGLRQVEKLVLIR